MALAFVGSHVGTHAATSAQSVAFTNLRDEANAQPTLLQNDIVIVAVNQGSTADRSQAQLTPSGYTAAHTDLYQNDSNDTNLQVSYKVMGASPDANVSIPASDSTANGVAYAIYVFRGADTATPLDVIPVTAGAINTGVANTGSITPSTSGAWIMAVGAAAVAAGAAFTNPPGMSATTNHFRSATITSTTVDANIGVALKTDWASGAFDPAVFGGSTSTNTGSWAAVTIALRPLVATGSASGSIDVTGSSAGTVALSASSAGDLALSGSSAGEVFSDAVSGTASGSIVISGAAAASVALLGAGSGSLALSGSTSAQAALSGAASGSLVITGNGSAAVAETGTSSGSLALTGSGTGAVALAGASAGSLAITGDASGSVGSVPVDGEGFGGISLDGSAAAAVAITGGATLEFTLAGSVIATVEINGGASGLVDLAGSAQGAGDGITGDADGSADFDGSAQGRVNAANENYPLRGRSQSRPLYGRSQSYPLRRAA